MGHCLPLIGREKRRTLLSLSQLCRLAHAGSQQYMLHCRWKAIEAITAIIPILPQRSIFSKFQILSPIDQRNGCRSSFRSSQALWLSFQGEKGEGSFSYCRIASHFSPRKQGSCNQISDVQLQNKYVTGPCPPPPRLRCILRDPAYK
jgi:hypothetical protein